MSFISPPSFDFPTFIYCANHTYPHVSRNRSVRSAFLLLTMWKFGWIRLHIIFCPFPSYMRILADARYARESSYCVFRISNEIHFDRPHIYANESASRQYWKKKPGEKYFAERDQSQPQRVSRWSLSSWIMVMAIVLSVITVDISSTNSHSHLIILTAKSTISEMGVILHSPQFIRIRGNYGL